MVLVIGYQEVLPVKKGIWLLPVAAAAFVLWLFGETVETSLPAPEDLYGVTLILDAGHGGADGGAVAADGTEEADINLEITMCMRDILGLYGIVPVVTRDAAELPYPNDADTLREKKVWDQKRRLDVVNGTENAVLISIHQNQYASASAKGAQVLWSPTKGSQSLAVWQQTLLVSQLDPDNRRCAQKIQGEIWLMNRVKCPAVLVECGFLSNPDELAQLKDDMYQRKLSALLVSGYLTWSETVSEYGGIFDGKDDLFLH